MRTNVIATIGPNSDSPEMLRSLLLAGMDIARNNFSHCQHDEYKERSKAICDAAEDLGKEVAILADLQGPRIRVGQMPKDGRHLREGEEIEFSTNDKYKDLSDGKVIYIDDPYLHADITVGEPIYLSSGEMALEVERIEKDTIYARVVRGGALFSRKGVNVPDTKLTTSGLTEKDIEDLKFVAKEGVDYVAVSFVQTAEDIEKAREIVGEDVKIIAKIETKFALDEIDSIITASDAIMIARGDLGIEIPIEKVPYVQKELIRQAEEHGKGAIVATQMLMSMTENKQPTRAEVSDIANAVWDGADTVMLSDETASGKYPVESVQMIVKVAQEAERHLPPEK